MNTEWDEFALKMTGNKFMLQGRMMTSAELVMSHHKMNMFAFHSSGCGPIPFQRIMWNCYLNIRLTHRFSLMYQCSFWGGSFVFSWKMLSQKFGVVAPLPYSVRVCFLEIWRHFSFFFPLFAFWNLQESLLSPHHSKIWVWAYFKSFPIKKKNEPFQSVNRCVSALTILYTFFDIFSYSCIYFFLLRISIIKIFTPRKVLLFF